MLFFGRNSETTIYLVDDEPEIREIYQHLLKKIGKFDFVEFGSLAEVKERLSKDKVLPILIISDIKMPGECGLLLTSFLAKNNMRVPLIHVTALNGEGDKRLGYKILNKPINTEIFTKEVRKALNIKESA